MKRIVDVDMKLAKEELNFIKKMVDKHNMKYGLFMESKHCIETLEGDTECVVIRSRYPGENNKYIVSVVKKGDKYVFTERYIV